MGVVAVGDSADGMAQNLDGRLGYMLVVVGGALDGFVNEPIFGKEASFCPTRIRHVRSCTKCQTAIRERAIVSSAVVSTSEFSRCSAKLLKCLLEA